MSDDHDPDAPGSRPGVRRAPPGPTALFRPGAATPLPLPGGGETVEVFGRAAGSGLEIRVSTLPSAEDPSGDGVSALDPGAQELLVVLEGTVSIRAGDDSHVLDAGDAVLLPPGMSRAVTAVHLGPVRLVHVRAHIPKEAAG